MAPREQNDMRAIIAIDAVATLAALLLGGGLG